MTDTLTITVIEPEELAPVGRLGEWLFAEGASLRMVRPWRGEPIPSLDEIGDGLVVLGGSMSAHDEGEHPWLADLRELLRGVVADDVPAIAICLGAQVAAEALGGSTAVPALGNDEVGVVELTITAAGESDPVFGAVAAEAIRAAHRAGISTSDGTRLPVIVSHHDAVTHLPEAATLLASSDRSPVHTWRAGRLLAFQHHPESDPARVAYWRTRDALNDLAGTMDAASLKAAGKGLTQTLEDPRLSPERIAVLDRSDPQVKPLADLLDLWTQMQRLVSPLVARLVSTLAELDTNGARTRFRIALARLHATITSLFTVELIDGVGDPQYSAEAIPDLIESLNDGIAEMERQAQAHRALAAQVVAYIGEVSRMMTIPNQLLMLWTGSPASTDPALPATAAELSAAASGVVESVGQRLAELDDLAARCQAIHVADDAADLRDALSSFTTAASAVAPS